MAKAEIGCVDEKEAAELLVGEGTVNDGAGPRIPSAIHEMTGTAHSARFSSVHGLIGTINNAAKAAFFRRSNVQ